MQLVSDRLLPPFTQIGVLPETVKNTSESPRLWNEHKQAILMNYLNPEQEHDPLLFEVAVWCLADYIQDYAKVDKPNSVRIKAHHLGTLKTLQTYLMSEGVINTQIPEQIPFFGSVGEYQRRGLRVDNNLALLISSLMLRHYDNVIRAGNEHLNRVTGIDYGVDRRGKTKEEAVNLVLGDTEFMIDLLTAKGNTRAEIVADNDKRCDASACGEHCKAKNKIGIDLKEVKIIRRILGGEFIAAKDLKVKEVVRKNGNPVLLSIPFKQVRQLASAYN